VVRGKHFTRFEDLELTAEFGDTTQ
jgi:hypothetical protein